MKRKVHLWGAGRKTVCGKSVAHRVAVFVREHVTCVECLRPVPTSAPPEFGCEEDT